MCHRNNTDPVASVRSLFQKAIRIILVASAILLSACGGSESHNSVNPYRDAGTANNTAAKSKSDIKLVVGPKYKTYTEFESAVWVAHALAKLRCEANYPQLSFENEFCALSTAVDIWREIKKKNNIADIPDNTLDDLDAVKKAGFMREYVWVYWRQEYWFAPTDLLLDKFNIWRGQHLGQHNPNNNPDIVAVHTESEIEPRFVASAFNNGYPDTIADLSYISDGVYFPTQWGKSVRYQLDKHSQHHGYADIYIYDIPKSQQGSERKSLTLAISSKVKAEILVSQQRGVYHDFSEVLEDTLTHTPSQTYFARGVYRLSINHVKYFSALYLCLSGDKIFKVRLTYPDNTHFQNSDHFKAFAFEAFEKLIAQRNNAT